MHLLFVAQFLAFITLTLVAAYLSKRTYDAISVFLQQIEIGIIFLSILVNDCLLDFLLHFLGTDFLPVITIRNPSNNRSTDGRQGLLLG